MLDYCPNNWSNGIRYGLMDEYRICHELTVEIYRICHELIVEIYRICHELTVEMKFIKRILKNVIKRAFGKLNNIFMTSLIKLYHNSQRMSDSFYHITESSEMN